MQFRQQFIGLVILGLTPCAAPALESDEFWGELSGEFISQEDMQAADQYRTVLFDWGGDSMTSLLPRAQATVRVRDQKIRSAMWRSHYQDDMSGCEQHAAEVIELLQLQFPVQTSDESIINRQKVMKREIRRHSENNDLALTVTCSINTASEFTLYVEMSVGNS